MVKVSILGGIIGAAIQCSSHEIGLSCMRQTGHQSLCPLGDLDGSGACDEDLNVLNMYCAFVSGSWESLE